MNNLKDIRIKYSLEKHLLYRFILLVNIRFKNNAFKLCAKISCFSITAQTLIKTRFCENIIKIINKTHCEYWKDHLSKRLVNIFVDQMI
jgi:hypothetical protein